MRGKQGFASMNPEQQKAIASKGGKAAHQKGTAHEWDAVEAAAAGRKGGTISRGGKGKHTPVIESGPVVAQPEPPRS